MSIKRKTKLGLIITVVVLVLIVAFFGAANLGYHLLAKKTQTGESVGYAWSKNDDFALDKAKVRTYNMGDKDYKILLIADVQRKNGGTAVKFVGSNHILDWMGETALSKLIKRVKPDLMLMLGDNVANKNNDLEMKTFADFFDKFKVPWAPIFGNHDSEGRANKAKLADVFKESEYCIFEYGPNDLHGAGNYIINLNRGDNIEYSLYMMDSGLYTKTEDGGDRDKDGYPAYDGINQAQTDWYNWATDGINALAGKQVKNMAFLHIPPKEYLDIQDTDVFDGEKNERPCSSYYDYGFFNSFKGKSGTHMFVGHDHTNSFVANFQGMTVGYAIKSSYNSNFKSGNTGCTLLTVKPDGSVAVSIEKF